MKQLIGTIIVVGLVGYAGFSILKSYERSTTERAYESALIELQRQFTESLGPIRSIETTSVYEREITALLTWYFAEIQKLRNRFPGYGCSSRVLEELEEDLVSGNMSQADFDQYKHHFDYVKWVFDKLESGDYGIVVTGAASNLRFDVYEQQRDRYNGDSQVRMDFILWGAPRVQTQRQDRAGVTITSVNVPVRFARLFFQFVNEEGHIYAEMSGASGEPYLKIVHPERWIPEFPPMAVLGRYWIDLFPDEAEHFVWHLDLHTTTTGGSRVAANFRWELDVPPSWKIGGHWGGTEVIRPQDYIERTPAE